MARVTGNPHVRWIKLKRHVKFIWNCANGYKDMDDAYGKLTRKDYDNV